MVSCGTLYTEFVWSTNFLSFNFLSLPTPPSSLYSPTYPAFLSLLPYLPRLPLSTPLPTPPSSLYSPTYPAGSLLASCSNDQVSSTCSVAMLSTVLTSMCACFLSLHCRPSVCGWPLPRSARLNCVGTSMWWSVLLGPRTWLCLTSRTPVASRYTHCSAQHCCNISTAPSTIHVYTCTYMLCLSLAVEEGCASPRTFPDLWLSGQDHPTVGCSHWSLSFYAGGLDPIILTCRLYVHCYVDVTQSLCTYSMV